MLGTLIVAILLLTLVTGRTLFVQVRIQSSLDRLAPRSVYVAPSWGGGQPCRSQVAGS